MLCGVHEILIGAQKHQVMPDAQLRNERIDCSDLNTRPATGVPHTCCSHMIRAIRLNQRQRGEPLDDLIACLGTHKALKKFLQYKAGRDNHVRTRERILQRLYLGLFNFNVTSQGK